MTCCNGLSGLPGMVSGVEIASDEAALRYRSLPQVIQRVLLVVLAVEVDYGNVVNPKP